MTELTAAQLNELKKSATDAIARVLKEGVDTRIGDATTCPTADQKWLTALALIPVATGVFAVLICIGEGAAILVGGGTLVSWHDLRALVMPL